MVLHDCRGDLPGAEALQPFLDAPITTKSFGEFIPEPLHARQRSRNSKSCTHFIISRSWVAEELSDPLAPSCGKDGKRREPRGLCGFHHSATSSCRGDTSPNEAAAGATQGRRGGGSKHAAAAHRERERRPEILSVPARTEHFQWFFIQPPEGLTKPFSLNSSPKSAAALVQSSLAPAHAGRQSKRVHLQSSLICSGLTCSQPGVRFQTFNITRARLGTAGKIRQVCAMTTRAGYESFPPAEVTILKSDAASAATPREDYLHG